LVATVKPGNEFIVKCYGWTGGAIGNNDSADDILGLDLSLVHVLSGPITVDGAEPGDPLVVGYLVSASCPAIDGGSTASSPGPMAAVS
jgi:formamidase